MLNTLNVCWLLLHMNVFWGVCLRVKCTEILHELSLQFGQAFTLFINSVTLLFVTPV